jgi:putative ABC transport system ATP-binding protein
MTDKVVVASALCKKFEIDGVVVEAVKNLDLTVKEGEFISIYGPSGAGKTTLLNMIGALDKPTSGKITVFSHDLSTYDEDFLATFRSAYIGFVFQSYNLISTLTAVENISFVVELAGWSKEKMKEQSETLLKLVGLNHRANHFPAQLSGGERQRVAFSQALAIILVSGTIGITLGLFITIQFLLHDPIISQSSLISVSAGLLVILFTLCISSLYPTMKAVKKTVIDALSAA